jgi:hypothetical protein
MVSGSVLQSNLKIKKNIKATFGSIENKPIFAVRKITVVINQLNI